MTIRSVMFASIAVFLTINCLGNDEVVNIGHSKDKVISILGKPKGYFAREKNETLIYDNLKIILKNGKVLRNEIIGQKKTVKPDPSLPVQDDFQPTPEEQAPGEENNGSREQSTEQFLDAEMESTFKAGYPFFIRRPEKEPVKGRDGILVCFSIECYSNPSKQWENYSLIAKTTVTDEKNKTSDTVSCITNYKDQKPIKGKQYVTVLLGPPPNKDGRSFRYTGNGVIQVYMIKASKSESKNSFKISNVIEVPVVFN